MIYRRRKVKQEEKTEMQIFKEKFPRTDKKNSYYIEHDGMGKILTLDSKNKDIIAYAKEIGLLEEQIAKIGG